LHNYGSYWFDAVFNKIELLEKRKEESEIAEVEVLNVN
jgi:hypothetical protein